MYLSVISGQPPNCMLLQRLPIEWTMASARVRIASAWFLPGCRLLWDERAGWPPISTHVACNYKQAGTDMRIWAGDLECYRPLPGASRRAPPTTLPMPALSYLYHRHGILAISERPGDRRQVLGEPQQATPSAAWRHSAKASTISTMAEARRSGRVRTARPR